MELQIQAEIAQAWFYYEAEKKKVAQYRAGVLEDSQKVLNGMVYKYKRGETSILDVLVAQRTYNEVQQEYLETMRVCCFVSGTGKSMRYMGYTFLSVE